MSATPPDVEIMTRVSIDDGHAFANDLLQRSADELRERGVTHARATILPSMEAPLVLIVEGWRVRPELETPVPA